MTDEPNATGEASQLPALFDPNLAFGYDAEQDKRTPLLRLVAKDDNAGQWMLGTTPLGNAIDMLFVARRYHRTLWAKSYEELGEGEENLIVCRSANGDDGYGLGRTPTEGEDWRKLVCKRQCKKDGKNVCPSAESFVCRPEIRALVLIRWKDGPDVWMPALFEAKGTHFKPVDEAYMEAIRRMRFSSQLVEGRAVPRVWLWQWRFRVGAKKTEGRKAVWIPTFPTPVVLVDDPATLPLRSLADEWVKQFGSLVWKADLQSAELQMMSTGELPKEDEASEGTEAPTRRARRTPDGPPPDDPNWNPDEIPF